MTNVINIQTQDGNLTVSSRDVAEHFEKKHCHVLDSIESLRAQTTSTENSVNLFIASIYTDSYGREQKEYLLTRDGFTLTAMGFTGAKALQWKMKYIEAFNEMERVIKQSFENLSPQLQLLINMEHQQKEQAKAITKVENKVEKLELKIETFSKPLEETWRDDMNSIINGLCKQNNLNYQTFRGELYNELEIQASCNLKARVSRLKERMDKAGAKYTDRKAITKLHVIDQDNKLKLIFEGIVKKYQMRYSG